MKIILSTRNPSKAEQIRAMFVGAPFTILTLEEAGIEGEAIEDGETLQDNSLKKALFVHQQATDEVWAMADDTGLFINALNGEPGVRTARWAGDIPTDEITQYTLQRLQGISDRSAMFETVVVLISPTGERHFFSGKVQFLEAPRVKPQPKMPYSPLFVPEGESLVWAEMSVEYENSISHRGKAFRQAREFLEKHCIQ